MMKKFLALALALLLLAGFSGCKKDEVDVNISVITPGDSSGGDTANDAGGAAELEPIPEHAFAMPDGFVEDLVSLVNNFNIAPAEFSNPDSLTDETLLFTAATYLSAEFTLNEDGFSYSLPLFELEAGVTRMFGGKAQLSAEYKMKQTYSPYEIDTENDALIRYPGSGVGSYYFTYALVEIEGGYELWLIDLMDPLFYGEGDNSDYLFMGGAVSYDMISDIAPEMQYNIYTIKTSSGGDFYIAGFRYRNYKNINHYVF